MRKWQQQQKGRQNYNRPMQIKQREASVTVKPDWIVLEEMEKAQLSKLSLPTVNEAEELLCCGTLEYYDKAYDRVRLEKKCVQWNLYFEILSFSNFSCMFLNPNNFFQFEI
jgi:translation initiation factor 3 subunit D